MADVERTVVAHLNASGVGAPAFYSVPSERPEAFATVELTGGARRSVALEDARLAVQCWGPTRRAALELAEAAKAAVLAMPDELPDVFAASVDSEYRDRDPDSGMPRYNLTVELTVSE